MIVSPTTSCQYIPVYSYWTTPFSATTQIYIGIHNTLDHRLINQEKNILINLYSQIEFGIELIIKSIFW